MSKSNCSSQSNVTSLEIHESSHAFNFTKFLSTIRKKQWHRIDADPLRVFACWCAVNHRSAPPASSQKQIHNVPFIKYIYLTTHEFHSTFLLFCRWRAESQTWRRIEIRGIETAVEAPDTSVFSQRHVSQSLSEKIHPLSLIPNSSTVYF